MSEGLLKHLLDEGHKWLSSPTILAKKKISIPKKKTMSEKITYTPWLKAIRDAATERSIELPPFIRKPMGLALTQPKDNGRFITIRYRLVPKAEAERDGIQWGLQQEGNDSLDLAFRQPAVPEKEAVDSILTIIKGWVLDNWSIERTRDSTEKLFCSKREMM